MPRTTEIQILKSPETSLFCDMRPRAIGKPRGSARRSVKTKISAETASPDRRSAVMPQNVMGVRYLRRRDAGSMPYFSATWARVPFA